MNKKTFSRPPITFNSFPLLFPLPSPFLIYLFLSPLPSLILFSMFLRFCSFYFLWALSLDRRRPDLSLLIMDHYTRILPQSLCSSNLSLPSLSVTHLQEHSSHTPSRVVRESHARFLLRFFFFLDFTFR